MQRIVPGWSASPRLGIPLALFIFLLVAMASLAAPALATDRYVDSGASCPGSGTSGNPYCSFSSINSLNLAPGDRVLLARGATFNVSTGPSLTLGDEDDGSSVSWNSVEPYGSGAKPIITGANAAGTIGIAGTDIDYWKFVEIEFKNAATAITADYTTLSHQGLRFQKLYVHDMLDANPWAGRGVYIKTLTPNPPVPGPTQWVLKDIQFTDNEFGPIGLYLALDGLNSVKLETFQDILFMRNYTHDVKWDEAFRYNKNVKWISNRNERIGSGFLGGGTTDLHLWALHDSTFVNSIFDYVYDSGSADQTFGDLAYRLDQTRFRNNLIEDAAGAGLEWHAWRTSDDYGLDPSANYYTNQEISGNVFRNNGWAPWMAGTSYQGSIAIIPGPCGTVPDGSISNNLYYEPTGFLNRNGCSTPSLTETNNLSVGASADISYAAQVFSDASCSTSPWSYESSTNGTSWTAMTTLQTVNPGTDVRCNGAGVPWVNRFEQYPNTGTSYTVARTWTAPSGGTVSIRSRALKAELGGDGVTVRVTQNGTTIIGPTALGASDQVGVVLNADSVAVTAGDKIRFEVTDGAGNTSDRISWSPAVAFVSGGGGGGCTGNLAPCATTSASSTDTGNGYCHCEINDGNTADWSGWASLDALPQWVQLTWGTSQTVDRVEFYTTDGGGYFTQDFQIQYWNGSSWVTPSGWSVTGNNLKHRTFTVTPAVSTTAIRVYATVGDVYGFARVDELEAYGSGGGGGCGGVCWEFSTNGNLEGWSPDYQATATVSSGSLHVTATGTDAQIYNTCFSCGTGLGMSSSNRYIHLRLQNDTSSTSSKIFFITDADQTWDGAKSKSFTINANSAYTLYVVDMGTVAGWTGTIRKLRIDVGDPSVTDGLYHYDFIKALSTP